MRTEWSEDEIQYLIHNYRKLSKNMICQNLNRSLNSVDGKLRTLKIRGNSNTWSDTQINYLRSNYKNTHINDLIEIIDKPKNLILSKVRQLKLKKDKGNHAIKLTENNLISLYWIGFLLADGHFHKNRRDIFLSLHIKEREHLEKFMDFLEYKPRLRYKSHKGFKETNSETLTLVIRDKESINYLWKKYDLSSRKTYEPPKIEKYKITNEQMISLIIGFIDGDGSIKAKSLPNNLSDAISINIHNNWRNNLLFINEFLHRYFNIIPKNTLYSQKGSTVTGLTLARKEIIKGLKQFTIDNNLPILERKWNKI